MAKDSIAEFAIKEEATPGTVESMTSSEVVVPLRNGYVTTPEINQIDLEELRSVSSHSVDVPGRAAISFAISHILRGPGDLVTAPAVAPLVKAAMFTGSAAKTIAIGAITSGPYVAGETITGGTSSATGLVLQRTLTGAASLPYLPLTGTMQSGEVLTGGTSSATSTTSAGPIDGGYAFRPADSDFTSAGHVSSCILYRDGFAWTGRGCLADMTMEFSNNGPCVISQTFQGAFDSHSDTALFGVSAFPESTVVVPKFSNVDLTFDDFKPTDISTVTVNWPTGVLPIEDANDAAADGVLHSDYDRKATPPTITLSVAQIALATFDYFTKLKASTTVAFEMTHGATGSAGTKHTLSAPKAQFQSITSARNEPDRATFDVTLKLTGSNNEEFLWWQH